MNDLDHQARRYVAWSPMEEYSVNGHRLRKETR
jgi:hypothetical protein